MFSSHLRVNAFSERWAVLSSIIKLHDSLLAALNKHTQRLFSRNHDLVMCDNPQAFFWGTTFLRMNYSISKAERKAGVFLCGAVMLIDERMHASALGWPVCVIWRKVGYDF